MFYSKLRMIVIVSVLFLLGFGVAWLGQADRAVAGTSQTTAPAPALQAPDSNPTDLAAPDASTWVTCTPVEVGVYSTRIHVRCNESYSGIRFFAYPVTNASAVSRYLSVLTTAQVAGRTLSVLYDPGDTSGTSIGCAASDCRLLQALLLH